MNERFLMCPPDHFGVIYEINPWMDSKNNVDHDKAVKQWDNLYNKISSLSSVELIDPQPHLPDMVFTANAGFVFGEKQVILSNFLHEERKKEEPLFEKWFKEDGFDVHKIQKPFEGAGDCFKIENDLYVGYGQRTTKHAYIEILEIISNTRPVWSPLCDPYFYHLDTCFCPLRDRDALWYEDAFGIGHRYEPEHELNVIKVPKYEARRFACNAVLINEEDVMIPSGCPQTIDKLRKNGYTPHEFEMSEYIKSGGACKCLTLKL